MDSLVQSAQHQVSKMSMDTVSYTQLPDSGEGFDLPDGVASVSRGYANQTPVRELTPSGLTAVLTNLNPAPGSPDLIEPRQAHGVPGSEKPISIIGAVTGAGFASWWTNKKTNAKARVIGQPGIVSGFAGAGSYGGDQLTSASLTYQASLQQMLTDQASANALYPAI